MLPTPIRLAFLTAGLLAFAPPAELRLVAQAPPQTERAVDEGGLTITCETFCSDAKLRTANARIRWYASKEGPEAAQLVSGRSRLQTTVFAEGFEKNAYVELPVGAETPIRQPVAAPAAAGSPRPLRAYQFQVIEVQTLRKSAVGTDEFGVVVENLEPGVSYSWRVLVETGAGPRTSPVLTCQVPVCPADIVEPPRPKPGVVR